MDFTISQFISPLVGYISDGNIQSIFSILSLLVIVLLISKPEWLEKWLSIIRFKKNNKILQSAEFNKFVQSAILRSISKTRLVKNEYSSKLSKYKYNIIKEQMDTAENEIDILNLDILNSIRRTLKEKLITFQFCLAEDGPCYLGKNIEDSNLHFYAYMLDELKSNVLADLRRIFRTNGFSDKTDVEYREYVNMNAKSISSKMEKFIRMKLKEYNSVLEYDEFTKSITSEIMEHKISKILFLAKHINTRIQIKIEKLEEDLSQKLKDVAIEEELNLSLNNVKSVKKKK